MESGLYKKYIGSPCKQEIDPKKKQYQDSIQKLHKDAHKKYIERRTKGYTEDNTADGMGTTYIPPAKDQSKNAFAAEACKVIYSFWSDNELNKE